MLCRSLCSHVRAQVRVLIGRFGKYLMIGEQGEEGTRTATLPRSLQYEMDKEVTLDQAHGYLSLPRTICVHDGKNVTGSIGRYGPYLKWNNSFVSLPTDLDVLTVVEWDAIPLVIDGIVNKKKAQNVLVDFGEDSDPRLVGGALTIRSGRYGPYINFMKVNAKLPSMYAESPEHVPREEAVEAVLSKIASGGGVAKGKGKGKGMGKGKGKGGKGGAPLPAPPKLPMSSYLLFCAEKRGDVDGKLGEVS